MLEFIINRFDRRQSHINEFYILTHPFYRFLERDFAKEKERYIDLWLGSITEAAGRGGIFAFIILDEMGILTEHEQEKILCKYAKKKFGVNRIRIQRTDHLTEYWFYDEDIKKRMVDRDKIKVTARGIYADRCVAESALAVVTAYGIPIKNAFIILPESIGQTEYAKKKKSELPLKYLVK